MDNIDEYIGGLFNLYHHGEKTYEQLEAEVQETIPYVDLLRTFLTVADQRDTFLELLNKIWREMYPDSGIDWEYPGQIVSHFVGDRPHIAQHLEALIRISAVLLRRHDQPVLSMLQHITEIVAGTLNQSQVVRSDGATFDLRQIKRYAPKHQPLEGLDYVK